MKLIIAIPTSCLMSLSFPGYSAIPLDTKELEKKITELHVQVNSTCANPKTEVLCNKTLENTQRAIQMITLSGANTPDAQARLAKLQVIQLNAKRLKSSKK